MTEKRRRGFWGTLGCLVRRPDRVVTVFPKGTVIKYDGLPCELLQDTPYYTETIQRQAERAHSCTPNGDLSHADNALNQKETSNGK